MEFKYKCNLLVPEVQNLHHLHGKCRVNKQKGKDWEAVFREEEMWAKLFPSFSEMGVDQAINIVKNTKAHLDLNLS